MPTTLHSSRQDRIIVWIAFNVVLGLLPVIVIFIRSSGGTSELRLSDITNNGEFFVIGTVISAEALGRLWLCHARNWPGTALLVSSVYSALYSSIAFSLKCAPESHNTCAGSNSVIAFLIAFFIAFGAILYAEAERMKSKS